MSSERSHVERWVSEAIQSCSLPPRHAGGVAYDPALDADRDFESLGFDSLTAMELCIALHCASGIEVSVEQMYRLNTPRALVDFLASHS